MQRTPRGEEAAAFYLAGLCLESFSALALLCLYRNTYFVIIPFCFFFFCRKIKYKHLAFKATPQGIQLFQHSMKNSFKYTVVIKGMDFQS